MPKIEIKKSEFHKGISFNELIIKINFAKSNGEFRRNISNKGYRLNNEIVLDEKKIVTQDDFKGEKIIKISFGKKQRNTDKGVLRQLLLEVVNILWEEQEGHRHAMTIGNTGSHHGGERSWWARGPKSLERLQEWEQWLQECHQVLNLPRIF